MYSIVLFLHSGLRWLLLAAVLVVIVRGFAGWSGARSWTRADDVAGRVMVSLVDLQFLLGLVLYAFLSPLAASFLSDPRAGMASPVLRFFAIEHAFAMVIAAALAHMGRALSRKAADAAGRHRRAALFALALFAVLLIGIPWPFLPYGRPLLRGL